MKFTPEPLTVVCNSCGKAAETWDYQDPDVAVECACCPEQHNHAGLGCRTVTIYAHARMTFLSAADLLEMAAETEWDKLFEPARS